MTLIKELSRLNGNTKGCIFLVSFRISSFFTKNKILKLIGLPIRLLYKIIFNWILCIDIPDSTSIGYCFNVYHGQGLVISDKTIIGNNVIVRQNTTIGNAKKGGGCPIIKDNVEIGSNSVIIGEIVIGNNSIIGAGSVVLKDVPAYVLAVGNPVRIVKEII